MAIHQAILTSVRLESLPKATIDIFLTVIETDGIEGCVAAGTIAASTALADARIEIIGLVVSCSAVRFIGSIFYTNLRSLSRLWWVRRFGWIPQQRSLFYRRGR